MLFNTVEFLIFFPFVIFLFYAIPKICVAIQVNTVRPALIVLLFSAGYFYSFWDLYYAMIMTAVLVLTYCCAMLLSMVRKAFDDGVYVKLVFYLSLIAILSPLAYYKYAHFFVQIVNDSFGIGFVSVQHVLPLGISFFSFTLIAFFVDVYRGRIIEYNPLDYAVTVSFFPHLIAGPILLHHDMMPQFKKTDFTKFLTVNIVVGFCIFCVGMMKKVYLADAIAPFASQVFDAVSLGKTPNANASWRAALCYTLQLYFDFSGYSDMAIGLSTMLGLSIPANFFSPYKSSSIIEFWRRWHISLAIFLREYLYIPLGGSRRGNLRKYLNILIVMFVCGLWHGAGWTYLVWGLYHGVLLVINHAWRFLKASLVLTSANTILFRLCSTLTTFFLVMVGWVIFRSDSMHAAVVLLKGMAGMNTPTATYFRFVGSEKLIVLQLLIVFVMPNVHQVFSQYTHALSIPVTINSNWVSRNLAFVPNLFTATILSFCVIYLFYRIIIGSADKIFLYCQF